MQLKELYYNIIAKDAPRKIADNIFEQLMEQYTQPYRTYHNISHIVDGLAYIEVATLDSMSFRFLGAAWLWHDIVYHVGSNLNEEDSAGISVYNLLKLGWKKYEVDRVHKLIIATKHDTISEDPLHNLIQDIDLMGLALIKEEFDANTNKIRKEYQSVTDEAWNQGRFLFFAKLLALKGMKIYRSPYFEQRNPVAINNILNHMKDLCFNNHQ